MLDLIEANYAPDGDDWIVAVTSRGQTLIGKAPGLIAARDRADQLVEKLAPEEEFRTVVHLLNGDAVEFTTAYLTARLAKTDPNTPRSDGTAEPEQPEVTDSSQATQPLAAAETAEQSPQEPALSAPSGVADRRDSAPSYAGVTGRRG